MEPPATLTGPAIYDEQAGQLVPLIPRTAVGRSRHNDLRLSDPSVSGEHARIEWRETHWVVRDLGSRNGSVVDGQPVPAGGTAPIGVGSCIEFAQEPRSWVVLDDRDPADAAVRAVDRTLLTATIEAPLNLSDAQFRFQVSQDEETANWSVVVGHQTFDLGSRAHVYMVVTLARIRMADPSETEMERGWTYADQLARDLGMTPETLKVQVYRARRQLQGLVVGSAGVIERRAATNQIRFGSDAITFD